MPWQQRGVIADAAKPGCGKGLSGDAGVAVRGHDQIGTIGDFRGDHQPGIGLHGDLDAGSTGGRGKPVFAVGDDDPDDLDAVLAQHVECRHAEMARADQGNPHIGLSVTSEASQPSIARRKQVSPRPPREGRVINKARRPGIKDSPCENNACGSSRFPPGG